jgi:hypothetical protein
LEKAARLYRHPIYSAGPHGGGQKKVFREHAANLNFDAAVSGTGVVAFDGKALKGSFDSFNDAKAKQVLSAFAVDTAVVLAQLEIDDKSNEIPAVQKLLEELDVAGHIVISMYADEKSDEAVVPRKRPNKGRQRPAEVVEGRGTADRRPWFGHIASSSCAA